MKKLFSHAIMIGALLTLLLAPSLPASAEGPTATTLLSSGGTGQKWNLIIIGDGFRAGNDQTTYSNWVQNQLINGVFTRGPFWEDMNAFNIVRVNAISTDSGLTQVNAAGTVTTARNTALGYRVQR